MAHKISKKEIPEILNNSEFWKQQSWPISKQRLLALYHNPESGDNDIVLYFYKHDGEIVSYLTVYHFNWPYKNENLKMGSASAWYSSPTVKGMGGKLMKTAFDDMDGNLMSHMFNVPTKSVYEKLDCFNFSRELIGYFYNFKNSGWFHEKNLKKQYSSRIDSLKTSGVELEYVNFVDTELQQFIEKINHNHLFKRNQDYYNWMLNFPWVISAPVQEIERKKAYYFTVTTEDYNRSAVKVFVKEKLRAFLILTFSKGILKIYFSYILDLNTIKDEISNLIASFILKHNAKQFICYDNDLNDILKTTKFFGEYTIAKCESAISKKFELPAPEKQFLNYGDGDCVFF